MSNNTCTECKCMNEKSIIGFAKFLFKRKRLNFRKAVMQISSAVRSPCGKRNEVLLEQNTQYLLICFMSDSLTVSQSYTFLRPLYITLLQFQVRLFSLGLIILRGCLISYECSIRALSLAHTGELCTYTCHSWQF